MDVDPDRRTAGRHAFDVTRIAGDANLTERLQRLTAESRAGVPGCRAASVTVIAARTPITMAATDDTATVLDEAQYVAGAGPCLSAARSERPIHIEIMGRDTRWPQLQRAALERGVGSSLSIPLLLEVDETFGALNMYGISPHTFTIEDEASVARIARRAGVVLVNVLAYWETFDQPFQADATIEQRAVVEQAKGALMVAHRISPEEAFRRLRYRSQNEGRALHDVAIDVIDDVSSGRAS